MPLRLLQRLRSLAAIVLTAVMLVNLPAVQAAATFGTLSGTVYSSITGKPAGGVAITADSPSQTAHTTSDAKGHYTFISLIPDSYNVTFQAPSLSDGRLTAISISADTQRVEDIRLNVASLSEIGHITARSRSTLVQPGVTADMTSIGPAQQEAASLLGGGSKQNSILSAISSAPGVLVPIGPSKFLSPVFIRGGDITQTGYELDGVPLTRSYDPYPNSPLPNIGAQEVQVYTGAAPVDQTTQGIGGYINEVVKTGTYPGFANLDLGVGAPSPAQSIKLEAGGADGPNRNFTWYVGLSGDELTQRILDQYNGAGLTNMYGPITNVIASDTGTCGQGPGPNSSHPSAGCYVNGYSASTIGALPLGPNGYQTASSFWGNVPTEDESDSIVNLHFAVPHHHSNEKDDVQVLLAQSQYTVTPNDSLGDFGSSLPDLLGGTITLPNGTQLGTCALDPNTGAVQNFAPPGCAYAGPISPYYRDEPLFTGNLNSVLSDGNLGQVGIQNYPGHVNGSPGDPLALSNTDMLTKSFSLEKIQYQHQISDAMVARLMLYSTYGDQNEYGLSSVFQPYFSDYFEPLYTFTNHTNGVEASLTDKLSSSHLLRLDVGQSRTTTSAVSNQYSGLAPNSPVALLVNANAPLAGCYAQDPNSGATSVADCSTANSSSAALPAASYVLPSASTANPQLVPGINSPTIDSLAGVNCGTGPCQYLTVSNGQNALVSYVGTRFSNISLEDRWNINSRIFADLGLRYDNFFYGTAHDATPGEQLYANSYNATHCVLNGDVQALQAGQACSDIGAGYLPTTLNASSGNLDYQRVEPRIGATYTLDKHNVFRGSIGEYVEAPPSSVIQEETAQPTVPSSSTYSALGYQSFTYPLYPANSRNIDISWEHSSLDDKTSLKLTPFDRKTTSEFAYLPTDPKNNVFSLVNGLNRNTQGVEMLLKRGDFKKNGFSGQFAYTYTHTSVKYPTLANGNSFVTTINNGLRSYNGYTQFCSQNPSDPRCPAGGNTAAPCYTTATAAGLVFQAPGTPSTACGAGMIANPYWNASPTNLLDPNGNYPAFSGSPGLGDYGNALSYEVPSVASLIVNYRHNRFSLTPSLQFESGAAYGSPLSAQGVAPDTCSASYTGSTAGDPRYVNGPPAGGQNASPYDASSCYGTVPIPDPQTGKFDPLGAFIGPSMLALNLNANYDLSPSATMTLSFANLFVRCFGGTSESWSAGNVACAYQQNPNFVGNFYNPGDPIQGLVQNPYIPTTGSEYTRTSQTEPFPLEVFLGVNFKL